MATPPKQNRLVWAIIAIAIVATVSIWQICRISYQKGIEEVQALAEERLTFYDGGLQGILTRMENLPYVMAHNDAVARLLLHFDNLEQLNRDLESLNYWAGTEMLYVMNAAGDVVASSTWRQPQDIIGQNYVFRPYFTAARDGRQGGFYAVGLATNKPGIFMSHGISREGRFLGVVVVKGDLEPLLGDWREGGDKLFINDENGVVILSSYADWAFKTTAPLSSAERKALKEKRQYGGQELKRLPFEPQRKMPGVGPVVRYNRNDYLLVNRSIDGLDWDWSYLAPLSPVYKNIQTIVTIGSILTLLIVAFGLYLRERRQKRLSRKTLKEAEAIKAINLRLQEEIDEHCRTEQALRDAQAELVQSSKLAALGQMAAGIVHELNQPIAAIKTHAASGRLLLDRNEPEKLRDTLGDVSRITEHMAEITAQLKSFAQKAPHKDDTVVVQESLAAALKIVGPLLTEQGVEISRQIPAEPLRVVGRSAQLEQVLVNLMRNSADAMCDREEKRLSIAVRRLKGKLEIRVRDNGEGIAEEHLEELFTPFFTTKEVGQGLGLGLSICYRIVSDLDGTIRAENNGAAPGATFVVTLPLVEEEA